MRSTFSATLMLLGCCFMYSFSSTGCDTNSNPSSGGNAGAAGSAGSGGAGGEPLCVPAEETCDGIDNDCDGAADEGCQCITGHKKSCYSGAATTEGVGPCAAGEQVCDATGMWGPCVNEVKPKSELCNRVDDDCNGTTDDMGYTKCSIGSCETMILTCQDGKLNSCDDPPETLEVCDGMDNNCNGLEDETFPNKGKACKVDGKFGPCAQGVWDCKNGVETCYVTAMKGFESCNNIDDDCDGVVDNDVPGTGFDCGTGYLGVCAQGTITCVAGKIDCFPITPSSMEKCNGIDDDCDGTIDDDNPGGNIVCDTGKAGDCALGTTACSNGVLTCNSNSSGVMEVCNGLDDNCDGTIDEGNPEGGVACGCNGTRVCVDGQLVCQGGPEVFLEEDFASAPGWGLDSEWDIKAPPMTTTCNDPPNDSSPTTDNTLAGVNIGGCAGLSLHGYYYLTSPVFDTSHASTVILSFKRWLRSDLAPFMNHVVQVYNGATWYTVWQNGGAAVADPSWITVSYNITPYRNANMRIRWGFNVGAQGAIASGSWNVDDVRVMAGACP